MVRDFRFTYSRTFSAAFPEFDLVRNAMYTDPDDQSVWLYHRWLVGTGKRCSFQRVLSVLSEIQGEDREVLQREIEVIKELLAEQPDSKCTCDPASFPP